MRLLALGVFAFLGACSIVSGSSDLTGGRCRNCADAASTATPTPIACGTAACDTSSAWCCVPKAAGAANTCAEPCPPATHAVGCFGPADCAAGTSCCMFRSNFQGEAEERLFTQCLPSCDGVNSRVCDATQAAGAACPAGQSCAASPVPRVAVCQ